MSERTVYPALRGDDLQIILASAVGEDTTSYTCTAKAKRLPGGLNSYIPSTTVAATFTVSTYAGGTLEDGTVVGPGWYLALTDAQTALLEPGFYLVDALVVSGSTERHTLPCVLQVQQTVT